MIPGEWRFTVLVPSASADHDRPAPARNHPPAHVAQAQARVEDIYRRKWATLHLRGLDREGHDDSAWLAAFGESLPCGDCKRHWQEMIARTPPDWTNYFGWTVDRHNEVNTRLGKPQFTVAAARLLWAA